VSLATFSKTSKPLLSKTSAQNEPILGKFHNLPHLQDKPTGYKRETRKGEKKGNLPSG
jgi:hypothetical protein